MIREYGDYLQDIVSAFEECLVITAGMTYEEFIIDAKTFKAIIRNLEIAGEAAKHIAPLWHFRVFGLFQYEQLRWMTRSRPSSPRGPLVWLTHKVVRQYCP